MEFVQELEIVFEGFQSNGNLLKHCEWFLIWKKQIPMTSVLKKNLFTFRLSVI